MAGGEGVVLTGLAVDSDGVGVGEAWGSPPQPATTSRSAKAMTERRIHDSFRPRDGKSASVSYLAALSARP
jgi:hypothetical protein